MRVLVTGGAGFIGSHICDELIKQDHYVLVIDNLSTGSIKNIEHLQGHKNFMLIVADITDKDCCYNIMDNYDLDAVCHQAALGSVPRSIATPDITHDSNVIGFFNILNNARILGIKRFVYASSSSVYGSDTNSPKLESIMGQPLSPYAASKYIDEVYAQVFNRCYNMETIGLRYFNIFGPRQSPKGPYAAVIPKFINHCINNEQAHIYGDGSYSRDFTYVMNAVYANIMALTTTNEEAFGQAYNIGSEENTSINSLYSIIAHECNKSHISPIHKEPRQGDVPHSMASIEKAQKYIGYKVIVPFRQGIKETVNQSNTSQS